MLQYEHGRTEQIVAKLVKVGSAVRFFAIAGSVVLVGAIVAMLGVAVAGEPRFGIIGAALGYLLGSYLASLVTVVLEWMAQSLVVRGEALHLMRDLRTERGRGPARE